MVYRKPLAHVSPGVSLAKPITDTAGNTLLPSGVVLNECLLYLLKLWDVESVTISSEVATAAPNRSSFVLSNNTFQHDLLQDIQLLETAISSDKCFSIEALAAQLRSAVTELSCQPRLGHCLAALQTLDDYTYLHSLSTALISMGIAIKIGWPAVATVELGLAAILHDMGKTQVPGAVLQKPGPLSVSEWQLMRKHPEYGCAMLSRHGNLNSAVLEAVLQHHERIDGSGYPQRLTGTAINDLARIIAIADVYDAMTSDRCYQQAKAAHVAVEEILTNEQLFDPAYGKTLISMLDIFPVGSRVLLADGAEGIVVGYHPNHPTRPQLLLIKDPQGAPLTPPVPCDLARRDDISIIKTVAN